MKTRLQYFDEKNTSLLCFQHYRQKTGSVNSREVARMRALMLTALEKELTPLQKICLTEYIMHGTKQKAIAASLGLNPSTVCRHIAAGMKKLKHAAAYYCA